VALKKESLEKKKKEVAHAEDWAPWKGKSGGKKGGVGCRS